MKYFTITTLLFAHIALGSPREALDSIEHATMSLAKAKMDCQKDSDCVAISSSVDCNYYATASGNSHIPSMQALQKEAWNILLNAGLAIPICPAYWPTPQCTQAKICKMW